MLTVNELHASVEEKEILKGINLHVNPGEVHAIMGPNGSGKSTLSTVIAGHEDYEVEKGNILFDGDDYLFKKYLINCNCYFDYGVGASTNWVLDNTNSTIISVDTDKKWINSINISNKSSRIKLNWINLGDLENWGRPRSYKYRDKFIDYISNVWKCFFPILFFYYFSFGNYSFYAAYSSSAKFNNHFCNLYFLIFSYKYLNLDI